MISLSLWLFFTVSAIFGMVGYDIAMKAASDKANVFAFTAVVALIATIAHTLAWGIFKLAQPETVTKLSPQMLLWALAGGIGIVIMDIGFFLGVKEGGLIRTNAVWLIGGLIMTVLFGLWFFHEDLTMARTLGLMLGVAAIALMILG